MTRGIPRHIMHKNLGYPESPKKGRKPDRADLMPQSGKKSDPPSEDRQRLQRLQEILAAHKGQRHLVVLQDFPDPDTISAAYAHQLISQDHGIEADIVYCGSISHQQNLALVNLLGIKLHPFHQEMDLRGYAGAVYVDHQGTTAREIAKALERAEVPVLMVLDHHEEQHSSEAEFVDIRPVGATATMYAQYLEQGILQLDPSREEHANLATALMHGLISDTNSFLRAGAEDFWAAAFLSRYRDAEVLERIMGQNKSKKTMEIIKKALENRIIAEGFSIAGIGYLRSENRDAVPQAADFLLTEENVHTAIVFGIIQGPEQQEFVAGSLRTSKLALDPDDFLKGALGRDASGAAYGGGKHAAGGFQIPVDFLAGGQSEEFRQLKWQTFEARIKQRFFDKIGYDTSDTQE